MSDHDTWNMFFAAYVQGALASTAHPGASGPDTFKPGTLSMKAAEFATIALAESNVRKKRETPAEPTPPQPDDDGWIKWEGGLTFPVRRETYVEVRYRDCKAPKFPRQAGEFVWVHDGREDDIVAYRIVSEAGVAK